MRAENDATIAAADLAEALRRLLPRGRLPLASRVTVGPGEPGALRFGVGPASEDVPAEGRWRDAVAVSASFLRHVAGSQHVASLRLTFHNGLLAANSATITATLAGEAEDSATAAEQPEPPPLADLPLFASRGPPDAERNRTPPTPADIERSAAFVRHTERVALRAKLRHAAMLAKAGDGLQAMTIADAVAAAAQDDDIRNEAVTVAMLAKVSWVAHSVLEKKRAEQK